jgi:hypothetical protein
MRKATRWRRRALRQAVRGVVGNAGAAAVIRETATRVPRRPRAPFEAPVSFATAAACLLPVAAAHTSTALLHGNVAPRAAISLTQAGKAVHSLPAGTYRLTVEDRGGAGKRVAVRPRHVPLLGLTPGHAAGEALRRGAGRHRPVSAGSLIPAVCRENQHRVRRRDPRLPRPALAW